MVLFIRDENRLKDLWKTGIVTKVIRSSVDNIPRTIELRTATSKRIVRPIQKLAIPEWQIAQEDDKQLSKCVVNINNISLPELCEQKDIEHYLTNKQPDSSCWAYNVEVGVSVMEHQHHQPIISAEPTKWRWVWVLWNTSTDPA